MTATTRWRLAALALIAALLVGCAAPQQSASTEPLALDQAVTAATDALALQTQNLPAFLAKLDKRARVIDPMIDSGSGQQTALTRLIEEKVVARLTSTYAQLPARALVHGGRHYVQ